MEHKTIKASIKSPVINAYTFPEGPKGRGIKKITHEKNMLTILYDDESSQIIPMLNWWFGTRSEYNCLLPSEKNQYEMYFIEEAT